MKRKIVKDVVKNVDEPRPKLLFSIVYQVPFEPDASQYDTTDLAKMAAAAEKDANETPLAAFLSMAHLGGKYKVKVSTAVPKVDTGLLVKP